MSDLDFGSLELRDINSLEGTEFLSAMYTLFDLLQQRTADESISHKKMPSLQEHIDFVMSEPYAHWYLLKLNGDAIGSIYLTDRREVGISLFWHRRRQGFGKRALQAIMALHPGELFANVNPNNPASAALFKSLGFGMIQHTYRLDAK